MRLLLLGLCFGLLCGFAICFGQRASACIFFGLSLSLGLGFGSRLRVRLSFCPRILHGALFCRHSLLLLLLERQDAGVFGHLRGAARCRADRGPPLLAAKIIFRPIQKILRFTQTVSRVLRSSGSLGDSHRVPRLEQIQRRFRIGRTRGKLSTRNIDGVLPAFQHVEPGIDGFFEAFGFIADNIFHYHQVTGTGNGEIRLSGHDHAEGLQISGDLQAEFPLIIRNDLAEVYGAALRRDCPEHVRKVLRAKLAGRRKMREVCADFQAPRLAVDFSFTGSFGHQAGAFEVDHSRSASVAVVHSFRGARDYLDPEYRRLCHGFDGGRVLLGEGAAR